MIEYRIGWEAASNVSFGGHSDWSIWTGDEQTEEAVEAALQAGGPVCEGLQEALNESGFGWWPEIRTVPPPNDEA